MRLLLIGLLGATLIGPVAGDESPSIEFDLPPLVAAEFQDGATGPTSIATVELRLSSLIRSPAVPKIDQWLVQCRPRDPELVVADYAPRTEVASDVQGPIQIKRTSEDTQAAGLTIDGAYGHLARLHSGFDQTNKETDSYQLDQVAPVQAVKAAGTILRGRGVYFKLRWTAQQVLEGEKTFRLSFHVPQHWRCGLLDVSVVAESQQSKLAGLDQQIVELGQAHFVVAMYRAGDQIAAEAGRQLVDAELQLRRSAAIHPRQQHNLTSLVRHVVRKFDLDAPPEPVGWIERLITAGADPHLDDEIRKLPMPVRIAVLDYVDLRDTFLQVNQQTRD